MPKISACIVAYCDYDEVCAAVRSVLANTPGDDFALYVVDNASPDGCGPRLAQTDFGDVHYGPPDQRCTLYPEPGCDHSR